MTTCPPLADIRLPKALPRYVLWLVVAALVFVFTGCSMMPATRGYTDTRIDDVKTYADAQDVKVKTALSEAGTEVAEFVDPLFPGYAAAVRDVYAGKQVTVSPLPERDDVPWDQIILAALGAFGLGVPASVTLTNHIRDRSRRNRGEATSVPEAVAKGYFQDGKETA